MGAQEAVMEKTALTDHPVHSLIAARWSPLAFADKPVAPSEIAALLEAARWAASCFNDQPWAFLLAFREDEMEFERMLSCLVPANQRWAKAAAVLMISIARRDFTQNNKPNRHAYHDVGLAMGNLCLEATARSLAVHQMGGFDLQRTRELYQLPENHDPVAAVAIGYPGDPDNLPDEQLRAREQAPRTRKSLREFVYAGRWGARADRLFRPDCS
jgi:nitroreductase